jgi:iron complex outermembrane recepter protein
LIAAADYTSHQLLTGSQSCVRSALAGAITVCAILYAAPVQARTLDRSKSASERANASEDGATGDIVVTAMRREERLQSIPATITALESDILAKTGTTTLDQIAERTPGFSVTKIGDIRPRLYIRGVGTREYDPGAESSVGVFVDDIYVGRLSSVLSSLQDIERIEVLKGPQTTLYGRNTIGGAVNVVSKAPTEHAGAEARTGFGTFGSHELFATVSGPLAADSVLVRIMAYQTRSEGYVINLTTGHHSQGYDDFGGRVRLLLKPNANVRISLIGDFFLGDGPSVDAKNMGSPADPGGTFFSGTTIGSPGAPKPAFIANRFADVYNRDSQLHRRTASVVARTDHEMSAGTITGITAYRSSRLFETRDFDASSLDAVTQTIRERSRQFTQELRFTSANDGALSLGSRLRWVAGLFYYRDETVRTDRFDFGPASISALRTGSSQYDAFAGDFSSRSWAAYGEATLDLTTRLSLIAGLRYTDDDKHLIQTDTASRPGSAFIGAGFKTPVIRRDDKAWTPKLALSFGLSDDILTYASYTSGYKGGGFQYIPTTIAAARTTFRPERSNAFEVGFKSQFWKRRGTFNISAFYYDDRDLQVQRSTTLVDGSIAIVTSNAEKSRITGIDIDASLEPVNGLNLAAAYSYVNARYISYHVNHPGQPLTPATDFSGTPMIRTPEHSLALSADYKIHLRSNGSLTSRIGWTYRSTFFFEPGGGDPKYGAAIPMTREKGYGLVDVSLVWDIWNLKLRAYANNVLNRYYRSDVQKLPLNYIVNFPGQPRTYGITASITL